MKEENSCPQPNGVLLIVGGHEDKTGAPEKKVQKANYKPLEVLKTFLELTGKDKPVIEVITSASSEGQESFADYEKAFRELGLANIGHIHHNNRGEAKDSGLADRIREADGVFFSGGDQLKLTSLYGGTPMLYTLKQRYIYDKVVIGGTSAGAMAMSTPMIFAGNAEAQQLVGEIKITTGLEFLKEVCIDTHFVDRGRFIRMAQVVATNPTCIGLGIEEDTALLVRQGDELEVVGSGTVVIIEGFGISDSNILDFGTGKTISIQDLNVKLLGRGDRYMIPRVNPPHL
ncbi:cyanophycinase [Pedobacter sp. SYP-B3415]|uniref:cyanophycinase n=1 Tax=Pedobacter sp. SYP-B3415 TaxID=2496641 RepID=UPI00101C6A0C|nr:cyanophycinase [Pedobacter sp. SYP-B3415]